MLSVRLGREFYRPGAVFTHHRAGNGASAAVFDLNGRARLAATAKGRGVIVRDRVRAQHTLLVTHLVRQQKGRRGTFHFFGVINDFRFRFAVTAVGQQRPDGATAQGSTRNPAPRRIAQDTFLLKERFNAANGCGLGG